MSSPLRPEFEPLSETETVPARRSSVLPWLRLMRLPNVFTAIADVTMGYLFVRHSVDNGAALGCLIGSSASLYTAGMVLNDVFDFDVDAKERPFRPLPAGQISTSAATTLGYSLLSIGLACGWLAGWLQGDSSSPWRSGAISTALAGAVVFYDAYLKRTPLGPIGMGVCRFLNVLLGMSVVGQANGNLLLGYGPTELLAAAGIGIYIVGVTWFSRSETQDSRSPHLAAALIVMMAGVAAVGLTRLFLKSPIDKEVFWFLVALVMFPVFRRCGIAVFDPSPQKVQAGVKQGILSLIWLDAATVLTVAQPVHAISIAALLIPALLLGRWVYST